MHVTAGANRGHLRLAADRGADYGHAGGAEDRRASRGRQAQCLSSLQTGSGTPDERSQKCLEAIRRALEEYDCELQSASTIRGNGSGAAERDGAAWVRLRRYAA